MLTSVSIALAAAVFALAPLPGQAAGKKAKAPKIPLMSYDEAGLSGAYPQGWERIGGGGGRVLEIDLFTGARRWDKELPSVWAHAHIQKNLPFEDGQDLDAAVKDKLCEGTGRRTYKHGFCGRLLMKGRLAGGQAAYYFLDDNYEQPKQKTMTVLFGREGALWRVQLSAPIEQFDRFLPYFQAILSHLTPK